MPVRFEWRDPSKRAMCFIAEGAWDWKDYHQAARASAFSLTGLEHAVDSVIDLRRSARTDLPAGAAAHVRSFGRRTQVNLSGRAAVIGLPEGARKGLGLGADGTLETPDGLVKFVESEAELDQLLAEWAAS